MKFIAGIIIGMIITFLAYALYRGISYSFEEAVEREVTYRLRKK